VLHGRDLANLRAVIGFGVVSRSRIRLAVVKGLFIACAFIIWETLSKP